MHPFDNIRRYHENRRVRRIDEVAKLDCGKGQRLAYKLSFASVEDLVSVRNDLRKENAELRECDVPYYQRCCIDFDIRVGL
jgi:hypothetical protein